MIFIDLSYNYCSNHELIDILVSAIEAKDKYTQGHSNRVAEITSWICSGLNINKRMLSEIHIAAHLHDIGKINVPDNILNKKDELLTEEWELIKLHPTVGFNILSKVSSLKPIAKIVLHHHERWDGKGYPDRLTGIVIPFGSRVIAIADAIDAMLSDRPYRNALTWNKCKEELLNGVGKQFDSELINITIEVCEENRVCEYMEASK